MEGALEPIKVSTKQQQIAELASAHPKRVFTSLHHYIDYEWLYRAYVHTRKDGAVGVDRQTSEQYAENLKENLETLLERLRSGQYRAPAIRRTYIPKGKGERRPLGIPTFEDKIAQRAVSMLLEPLYEQDFKDCSYGFRKGRSAHQALRALRNHVMDSGVRWVIDVDIRKYFDSINHQHLRKALDQRVKDGVLRKLIDRWLKAGILENGQLRRSSSGTPQGGVLSPLLANIFLHYVLDNWFEEVAKPRLEKRAHLVRYCDDFVILCESYRDCRRIYRVLGKRLERFDLELHPEKTKIVDFRFLRPEAEKHRDNTTFNFLGFTHIWGRSRRGKWVVFQRTAKDRLARSLTRVNRLCRTMNHHPLPAQHRRLSKILTGHYAYFGITGNGKSIRSFWHRVQRIWWKWLGRRSREAFTFRKYHTVLTRFPLPVPRIVHQYTVSS
jgi:group II intron reverse transcriptase/maturase